MASAVIGPMGYMYLLTFAVTFAFANLEGTFTSYLMQQMGFSQKGSVSAQGWIFTYIGFIIVIVQGGVIRPLVKKYGEAPLVIAGVGLMAAGFLLFPLARMAPMHYQLLLLMLVPMVLISVGNGLNTPALRALISRKVSASSQGEMLGISASFDSLARAVGPTVAGYLYDKVTPQSPYWCAGLVMTLSLLIALGKFADLKASSQVPAPKSPTDVEATAK
jgi:MFS family permease